MQMEITREIAAKVLHVVDQGLSKGVGNPKPGEMCVEAAVCYALGLPHGDDPGCVASTLRSLKIRLNDSSWSSAEARAKGLRRLAVAQLGSKGALDEREFVRRLVDYAIRKSVPSALRSAASVAKDEKHKAALCEAANRCEKEGTSKSAQNASEVAMAASADAADAAYSAARAAASAYAYAASASTYNAADNAAANAARAAAYAAADAASASAYADAASASASAYAYAAAASASADYAASAAASAASATTAASAYAAKKSDRDTSLAEYCEAVVQILIDMKAPGCVWLDLTEVPQWSTDPSED